MDKVLIIGSNSEFVDTLKAGLDQLRLFEVLIAEDDLQAVETLFGEKISVAVIDINSTGLDCFETIAYMTRAHPSVPLVLMTGYQKPWFHEKKGKNEAVYHLKKPFKIGGLASAIFVGLTIKDSPANSRGMTVSSLLPLIEMHRKTCRMEVTAKGKGKGYLYFTDGVLMDAHLEGLGSEAAAREISHWDEITVKFSDLPGRRARNRVSTALMDLAGASWTQGAPETGPDTAAEVAPVPLDEDNADTKAALVDDILKRHREELRNIRGGIGLVVTDSEGKLLGQDIIDPGSGLGRLATDLEKILSLFSATLEKHNLGRMSAMTIDNSGGTLRVVQSADPSGDGCRLTGLLAVDGDRRTMASLMQRLFQELVTSITREAG